MPFWEDDVDEFFQDFINTCTLSDGTEINVIFDESREIFDLQGRIISSTPAITCKSTDVSSLSVGDTVTIDSTTYYLREILDDKTGITVIRISKN